MEFHVIFDVVVAATWWVCQKSEPKRFVQNTQQVSVDEEYFISLPDYTYIYPASLGIPSQ